MAMSRVKRLPKKFLTYNIKMINPEVFPTSSAKDKDIADIQRKIDEVRQ